jgi:hypothetical protein
VVALELPTMSKLPDRIGSDSIASRCALCDEEEPTTWMEIALSPGQSKLVAVCAGCRLDLDANEPDDSQALE